MFVEGRVEVRVKDRRTAGMDAHDLKVWLKQSFMGTSCYRVSDFQQTQPGLVCATVAVALSEAPGNDAEMIKQHPKDIASLKAFIEKMFDGRGVCRCINDPVLRES